MKIMPQVCIGTVNQLGNNYKRYKENIKNAIDFGYNHIDCADCYFIPMEIMKEIIHYGIEKYGRDNFWITWKSNNTKEEYIKKLLDFLELDYFDLYLIHHDYICNNFDKLEELAIIKHTTTYIKNIGLSNCEKIDKLLEYNKSLNINYGFGIYAIEIQARPYGVKVNKRNNILNEDFYEKCYVNNIKILLFSPISGFLNKLFTKLNNSKYSRLLNNLENVCTRIIEYYTINYIKNKNNVIIIGVSSGDGYKKSFSTIKQIIESNNRNNILKKNTTIKNLLENIGLNLM